MDGAQHGRFCVGELNVTWRKLIYVPVAGVPLAGCSNMATAQQRACSSGVIVLRLA